jgi:SAM-dependent methyltransferase
MPLSMMTHDAYPELRAGGFTRRDGSVQFYVRIHALLAAMPQRPVIVDFGAGRGAQFDVAAPMHRQLMDLRGHAESVIGVDVDKAVLNNPFVTRAHVVSPGVRLPVEDSSVDLVIADHVFEHLTEPSRVATELTRILRDGGWICARTPNKWGYIAVGARLVPNRLHSRLLRSIQPTRESQDVFPTEYRLNTWNSIAEHFPSHRYEQIILGWTPEPAYGGSSRFVTAMFEGLGRVTPERFMPVLLIFLRLRSRMASRSDLA